MTIKDRFTATLYVSSVETNQIRNFTISQLTQSMNLKEQLKGNDRVFHEPHTHTSIHYSSMLLVKLREMHIPKMFSCSEETKTNISSPSAAPSMSLSY